LLYQIASDSRQPKEKRNESGGDFEDNLKKQSKISLRFKFRTEIWNSVNTFRGKTRTPGEKYGY
jgi:hypothetical protein